MFAPKTLKLTELLDLTVNDLYEEEAIDDIKEELESKHGAKLTKTLDDYHLYLTCLNFGIPNGCSYCFRFRILYRYNRPTHRLLVLDSFLAEHTPGCCNKQIARFLKNKKILSQNNELIAKIIRRRCEAGDSIKNPTQILEILSGHLHLDKNFLYEGLQSIETKRKIKKKFDNIIADARRKCKQLIHSSGEKSLTELDDQSMILDSQKSDKEIEGRDNILDVASQKMELKYLSTTGCQTNAISKPLKKKISKTRY